MLLHRVHSIEKEKITRRKIPHYLLLIPYFIAANYKHLKTNIMTYQEANSISIKDYLESLGILPVVDKLYYGMYHSPLRQDDKPSFKVDYGVNLWCDFGTGDAP